MIPDPPDQTAISFVMGGEGSPAPDAHHGPSGAGWIPCAICTHHIRLDQYRSARCWTDPFGVTVAAHHHCLVALGETDLDLPAA